MIHTFIYTTELSQIEKAFIEAFATPMGIAYKSAGKNIVAHKYNNSYTIVFLINKGIAIVIYKLQATCVLFGFVNDIIVNYRGTTGAPILTEKVYLKPSIKIGLVEHSTWEFTGTESLLQIVRGVKPEFTLNRISDINLFSICNSFTAIIKNAGSVYTDLYCVIHLRSIAETTKIGNLFSSLLSNTNLVIKIKSAFEASIDLINRYEFVQRVANRDYDNLTLSTSGGYSILYEIYYDSANKAYFHVKGGDNVFNSNGDYIIEPYKLYDAQAYFNYMDISKPTNPAYITMEVPVQYSTSYFFDITEENTGINNFSPELSNIESKNLRYLFDIPLIISNDSAVLPHFAYDKIALYLDNNTLKYRLLFSQPGNIDSIEYKIHILDYSFSDTINFDFPVELKITFTLFTEFLIDINEPTIVPVTTQDLFQGQAGTSAYSWYNVLDNLDYTRILLETDFSPNGAVNNVANMDFFTPALPSPKNAKIPLLAASTGSVYNYPIDNVLYGQIKYNDYVTNYNWHLNFTGDTYTYTAQGLPIEENLTIYGIAKDYFGDTVVRVETATISTFFIPTNKDTIISYYIFSPEDLINITDIISLISYVKSAEPICTYSTGDELNEARQWNIQGVSLNYSVGFEGIYENYPLGLFYYTTLADSDDYNMLYGSLSQAWGVRCPIGVVPFTGSYDHSNVSFLPNIFALEKPLQYTKGSTSILPSAKRFHRIYLTDLSFNRIGKCDLLWSVDLQISLIEYMQYYKQATDIILAKGTNEEVLTQDEIIILTSASNALNNFNSVFLPDILYNDFVSYQLLYYIFGANTVVDSPNGSDAAPIQEVIIVLTTDEVTDLLTS